MDYLLCTVLIFLVYHLRLAAYSQLNDDNKDRFRYMLNKDAATFQQVLDFSVRNV